MSDEINYYGLPFRQLPDGSPLSQLSIERYCFKTNRTMDKGGLGRYGHFRNICAILFPKLQWNDWLELMIHALCDDDGFPGSRQWVAFAGCAGSGKTFGSALYGTVWWLCDPENSSVTLATTTGKALRRRAWPEIQNLYHQIRVGNFVDSKTTWQIIKGDDKHSISGIAVEDGAVHKAVDRIKGTHTARQLMIVDEGQGTPEAVFEACTNLVGYPEDFQLLVMGNPWSRFDPLGKFAEPKEGWGAVHPGMDEWETKEQFNGKTGRLIRFDGERSPNIQAGKVVCKHLIDSVKLEGARKGMGDNSPRYWAEIRGYWPPEGLVKTVLTESEMSRMGALGKFVFTGKSLWRVAGHDPSFGGGDRPVIWFAKVGEVDGNYMAMQLEECVILKTSANSTVPINFQLAQQAIRECEARGVTAAHLAVDSSGGGRPYCDILEREWRNARGKIIREEFGGRPSDRELSAENWKPASEAYANRVTEMWFAAREMVMSGQLRGFDSSTAMEFVNRQYDDTKPKIILEKKEVMKQRFGKSPDLADAAALCVAAALRSGLAVQAVGATAVVYQDVDALHAQANAVYENVDYSPSNEQEALEAVI